MPSLLTKESVSTIAEMLNLMDRGYTNPKALNYYKDNEWHSLSTQEFVREVKYLILGLHKLGFAKEEKVGIMAISDHRWTIADMAIMGGGGVTVPLFSNISEENFEFEVHQPELKKIFISGEDSWKTFHDFPGIFEIAIDVEDLNRGSMNYSDLIKTGKELFDQDPSLCDKILAERRPDDLATIIYTSGSTGVPKGVEHTHFSLVGIVHESNFGFEWEEDRFLGVLPLAHILPRMLNVIMLAWGISIYYNADIKRMASACKEIHPTLLVVVPRLLEKVYAKMITAIQNEDYIKKIIAQWSFDIANQEEQTAWKTLFHPVAEKLVYSHLREALGGQLRAVFSGGAPLEPHLNHFFVDIGIPIYEGWGLTEACPLTVNRIEFYKIGTVGYPIDRMQIKVSPEGELLAKGTLVMRGYYKNEQATKEAFDEEGWLRTGDKGLIDEDGFITIIGRLKEIFKTSTGKMVAPIPLEQALTTAPLVETAIVVAENRKFVSVLVVPDFEVVKVWKKDFDTTHLSDAEFLASSHVKEEMDKLLGSINRHVNEWEKILEYRFIPNPLSIETGELTPSLKPRRKVIEQKYKYLIDSVYKEETL